MSSIGYPFESILNGRTRWDEHVRGTINGYDLVKMGRNSAVNLYTRLRQAHHRMKMKLPSECDIGSLRSEEVQGEFGGYNTDDAQRFVKQLPTK